VASFTLTEVRRNLAPNPRVANGGAGWGSTSTGGTLAASTVAVTDHPAGLATASRRTYTAASTGVATSVNYGGSTAPHTIPVAAGETVTGSIYGRTSRAGQTALCRLLWLNDAGTQVGTPVLGASSTTAADTWTRYSHTATAPVGATRVRVDYALTAGALWQVGDTIDATGVLVEVGATAGAYFDGDTPDASPVFYTWGGVANASPSIAQQVTADAEPAAAPTAPSAGRGATAVRWRDLTLATGADQLYRITSLEGWEDRPDARYDKQVRSRGHGTHSAPMWADERIVTVEGFSDSPERRDELLWGLQSAAAFDALEAPLTVTHAGRTLTAGAQLLAARVVRRQWGIGRFGWLLQWRCPDPLRYGDAVSVSTGLPSPGGGLAYDLTYNLDYGVLGALGQLQLSNPGTAPASIRFDVTGSLQGGFELSAGGQRLVYPYAVQFGQTLTIDTADGSVVVEGTADRRANMTVADWMQVPAQSTLTVQFTGLAPLFEPTASLTATVRGAYW